MVEFNPKLFYYTDNNYIIEKGEKYSNDIFCFDIETSTGYVINDKVVPFDKKKSKEYYKNVEKVGLCYIWQFGVNGVVYYGRELQDFELLLKLISSDVHKYIYVHFLAYEFGWLIEYLNFDKVFARTPHKPMFAICSDYNVTFRCSYFLTRLSLDAWGKNLPVKKLVGNLDYLKLRTPRTKLSDAELAYCENDILVMYYGLLEYRKKYNSVKNIPLTQTGEVRRPVKKILTKDVKWTRRCTNLVPDAELFKSLIQAFSGGQTHANYIHADTVITNVQSRDEASAYPWVLISEQFPITKFEKTCNWQKYKNDKYSLIMLVEFTNIVAVQYNSYLSASKAIKINKSVRDNGRIRSADYLMIRLTNVDFDIISQCYTWDIMNVIDCYVAKNNYLHDDFCRYIVDLYKKKTELKGVQGQEDLYLASKQFINSMYGMTVTNNIRDGVIFDVEKLEWAKKIITMQDVSQMLDNMRQKQYKNFLAYQFGVFVTAYARRNLYNAIIAMDEDVVYYDTDSVKFINNHDDWFDTYNNEVIKKNYDVAERLGVGYYDVAPIDKYGKSHPMGIFEDEGISDEFITLGAKKYCERKNGKLKITVSGVNKKTGVKALNDDINNFCDGLIFDYDASGRTVMTYRNDQENVTWNKGKYDEYTSTNKCCITSTPTTYTLGVTDEYQLLLQTMDTPYAEVLLNE